MKVLIIDDEVQSRNALRVAVQQSGQALQICGEAGSVVQATELIDALQPGLLLLDIRLGDGNGFDIIEKASWKNFQVIFLSAYSEYAVNAFRVHALDYLLKPINTEELRISLSRALQQQPASQQPYWEDLLSSLKPSHEKIGFAAAEGIHLVDQRDILFCEADNNYSRIRLANGEQIYIAKTLKELEVQLGAKGFLRIHKSYIVNLLHVKKYLHTDDGTLVLSDGSSIPVSHRKKGMVLNLLSGYIS
ncbi:LytTR family DNA-binding domain-containing protein [Ferruginibacter sp. HRS2-29]|uniref:LytR/AlgR family response regulator transcription factor n=1 Tax=Ferruginibacter sp. HRS2-29 TaxID=2487334 RepID=UPI0020CE2952|nr:LytTR family DNA-binding domain-containing protein [Ferruginibacter sp. HRS2-29]MCP9750389.1 DNA-binding response regulator [Ferruginibacter sp. HRS2-29]